MGTLLKVFFLFGFIGCLSTNVHSQSLLQMQHDYDEMKEKIASTTLELQCLEADRKRANYIKSIVRERKRVV